MTSVMISCGEPSGDLYAGALVRELRTLDPDVRVRGFGGERLRGAGADLIGDYRGLTVIGLVEAIRVLPRSYQMYRRLLRSARDERPDVLVAIDFPDFNFRLAAAVRALGVPVVYYIPPQLWAWRTGRIRRLRQIADRILLIFPFEQDVYARASTPATFVGHPLVELARPAEPSSSFLPAVGLDANRPTLALLPGSRPSEVTHTLPTLVEAARIVARRRPDVQFLLARAPDLADRIFAPALSSGLPIRVVEGRADEVLASARAVVTASGTATVQAAIHECPMVVVYRVAPLSYAIVKRLVHVDMIGMVNLVAGQRVAAELIQGEFTADRTAGEVLELLEPGPGRDRIIAHLREVKRRLGGEGASRRAAEEVLQAARSYSNRSGPQET